MLGFMRRNAMYIAFGIVVFFIGTMFTGIFFLKSLAPQVSQEKQPLNLNNAVAVIGEVIVPKKIYFNTLQQMLMSMNNKNSAPIKDPELMEIIKLNALEKATEYALFLESARKNKVKVRKQDLNFALHDIYQLYNLTGKKQLKQFLKNNQLPYKVFIEDLKDEIRIQKIIQSLKAQVQVTNQDVYNQYTKLKLRHILIQPKLATMNSMEVIEIELENAKLRAEEIREKIIKGMSFSIAAQKYSDDINTREKAGLLGWISAGNLGKELEDAAYSLEKSEISMPVRSVYGYHLITVDDKKHTKRPKDFDLEKEKKRILLTKQKILVERYLNSLSKGAELEILNQDLIAAKAKLQGKFQKASGAYQGLISQAPSNPIPHYLLARLYIQNKKNKKALKELMKAELLADLSPNLAIPQINIELGKLYAKNNTYKKMKIQFDKAIVNAGDDIVLNKYLLTVFKEYKDKKRTKIVKTKIKILEEQIKNKNQNKNQNEKQN